MLHPFLECSENTDLKWKSTTKLFHLSCCVQFSVIAFPLITVFQNLTSSIVPDYVMFCGYANIYMTSNSWKYIQVIHGDS